jgi:hypothetical protein
MSGSPWSQPLVGCEIVPGHMLTPLAYIPVGERPLTGTCSDFLQVGGAACVIIICADSP